MHAFNRILACGGGVGRQDVESAASASVLTTSSRAREDSAVPFFVQLCLTFASQLVLWKTC